MYLPKSKYVVKNAAYGQFRLSGSTDGRCYVGPYIEDYLGRTFAGSDISVAEQRVLISITEEPTPRLSEIENVTAPEEEDFITGSYTRYFRQNRNTKVIEEITEDRVSEKGNYRIVSGTWILTGSLDDRLIYDYPYRGVRYRNNQMLQEWEKEIPGISSALEITPEQFVREI